MITLSLSKKIQPIRALFLDVDGVFTDGGLYFDQNGECIKRFSVLDGYGIEQLHRAGIITAVISGRDMAATRHRLAALGIMHLHMGVKNKLLIYQHLQSALCLENEHIAYMGDDIPDLEAMQQAGLQIAPKNAVAAIKNQADYITSLPGGHGAVREACDLILSTQSGADQITL